MFKTSLLLITLLLLFSILGGQVPMTSIPFYYSQDFNSLGTGQGTWVSNPNFPNVLRGWYIQMHKVQESGGPYYPNSGTILPPQIPPGIFSFGLDNHYDRALGLIHPIKQTIPSNLYGYMGLRLKNQTAKNIGKLFVRWTGEQWRRESESPHSIDMSYRIGTIVDNLRESTGDWIPLNVSFNSPKFGDYKPTALNGNLLPNRVGFNTLIFDYYFDGIYLRPNDEIMIRWADLDNIHRDHYLAIDEVGVIVPADGGIIVDDGDPPDRDYPTGKFRYFLVDDIPANMTITFTDNPWTTPDGPFGEGEGHIEWTATTDLPRGSCIDIVLDSIYTASTGTITTDYNFTMSGISDQIIAFSGSWNDRPTDKGDFRFICAYSRSNFITSGATTPYTSYLPDALSNRNLTLSDSPTEAYHSCFANGTSYQDTVEVTGTRDDILSLLFNRSKYYKINSGMIDPPAHNFTFNRYAQEPPTQPIGINFTSISSNSADITFTNAIPSASGYLVVRKQGSTPTAVPEDGWFYGIGCCLGDGIVVSQDSVVSFTDTGLLQNTQYYYKIFSYNGQFGTMNYLTTNPLTGNFTTSNGFIPHNVITSVGVIDIESDIDLYYDDTLTLSSPSVPNLPDSLNLINPKVLALIASNSITDLSITFGDGIWDCVVFYNNTWNNGNPYPCFGPGTSVFYDVPFGENGIVYVVFSAEEDPTLPVELSSFTATVTAQNYVNLQWITQSETNVQGFYIYRNSSENLESAFCIPDLITATNTSQESHYSYTDEEVAVGETWYYWLQNLDMGGETHFYGPINVTISDSDDDITPPVVPSVSGFSSIFPNPFSSGTSIKYILVKPEHVNISVYNTKGGRVRRLISDDKETGSFKIFWDGRDEKGKTSPSGIYLIKMVVGKENLMRKVVLVD